MGGKDGKDVLSFCFVEVGNESVVFEDLVVVLCVLKECVLFDLFDGFEVNGVYLLEVLERGLRWVRRLLLLSSRLLLRPWFVWREERFFESFRSSLLVSS